MSSSRRSVTQNASALMVSQLITWGLTLLLTLFLPRHLGDVNMGKLHLGNSIWLIAAVFATFGMDLLLTKEIARSADKTAVLLGTSLLLRIPLYILSFGGVALYARLANYPSDTIRIIGIIGISALIWQLGGAFRASLEGLEQMTYISMANIVNRTFNTLVALALVLLGRGVMEIAAVSIGAATVYLLVQWAALRRIQSLRLQVDWQLAKWMLKASIPYFLSGVFLVLYVQMDVVIISLLIKEERVVGWYGVVDNLFGTMLFIPTVFITAIFPLFSRMHAEGADELPPLVRRSFNMLLLLSVPIGFGTIVIANPLVVLLFGDQFVNSGPILAVMGIVLLLMYQNILIGRFLVSTDRQNSWTAIMALATLLTVILDIILIPLCDRAFGNGAIGGAITYVITEGGMMAVGIWLLPKGSLDSKAGLAAARTVAAGLIMAASVWLVREQFIAIPIAMGVVTYLGAILLLRAIPSEDMSLLKRAFSDYVGRKSAAVAK